ncbi:hypothetical protein I0C86_41245 [Plantactinospora sp. S1510]|uniref:Antitoxin VbhA domain-containing protein n=1 Tax=Plantactinospora alkalitolerans TaxID=2789879 RepID=A0ABS0HAU6_9ACTN|nr:hypothetical protein [Plantactinospora alkalitolerans]MBF9135279.1 hypothetical protein [Plantactinospora alkalitolerans]
MNNDDIRDPYDPDLAREAARSRAYRIAQQKEAAARIAAGMTDEQLADALRTFQGLVARQAALPWSVDMLRAEIVRRG